MRRGRLGGLPIFWQTLILLVASVLVAQAMGLLVLLVAPPPRPDFNRLSDVAAALGGQPAPRVRHGRGQEHDGSDRDDRDRQLRRSRQPAAPEPRIEMVSDQAFVHALAERLGRRDDEVRLFYEAERRRPLFTPGPRRPFSMRDGEPLFFTAVVAGVRDGAGWTIAQTPPPPLVAPWQRRVILWFGLSALAMAPIGWMFARAMARPIHRFAAAAERLGADAGAPPVPVEGPAELRVTARALNGMQQRLTDYVGERTAMIGAIAHDLRTPLARIAFRIEAAPEGLRDKVMADIEQMRAMLAATIGFVRDVQGAVVRAPVDLAAMVTAMVEQDRDLGRDVTSGGIAAAVVDGDALSIERAIQNLVDNALAYAGAVEVALAADGGQATITVGDRGPGMSDDLLARAFQPFVRGEPSRNRATGGIGLGLTIARTIAEKHGGALVLANRDGGGLAAVLRLPLAG